jgi:hypothetical protein
MRIVSWNRQGQKIQNKDFGAMLQIAKVDVIVIQEPSGMPTAKNWDFQMHTGTGARDSYAIGVRAGGTIDFAYTKGDPRRAADIHGDARSFLVAQVTIGDETITLTSCHAPHSGGSGTSSSDSSALYMTALGGRLERGFRPKPKDGDAGASTGKPPAMPATPVMADLFMGDTNLYEPGVLGGDKWLPEGWKGPAVGNTTGKGSGGSPVDRIAYRAVADCLDVDELAFGRIWVGDQKLPGAQHKQAKDLILPDEEEGPKGPPHADGWVKSDHMAIYFDTRQASTSNRKSEAAKSGDKPEAPAGGGLRSGGSYKRAAIPAAAGDGVVKKVAEEKKDPAKS